jgi:hypothetical protein
VTPAIEDAGLGSTVPPLPAECRPDIVIIGAPKSATSWLKWSLGDHPDISVHDGEVSYFDAGDLHLDLEEYADLFRSLHRESRLAAEKSPNYLFMSERRIRRMRELLPEASLLVVLREPVERAWSHAKNGRLRLEQACSDWRRRQPGRLPRRHWAGSVEEQLWPRVASLAETLPQGTDSRLVP